MAEHLLPISKTNVVTLINPETDYAVAPTTASSYRRLAFNANSLARQQTLIPNPELRGSRMQGALVPGPKNPGGPFQGYQTDQTLPMFYEALFGKRTTSSVPLNGPACSATNSATAGIVDSGTHSYKVVVTNATAQYTLPGTASGVVTADGSHKVTVTRIGGALPTGYTWDLYRTIAGNTGNYKKVNTVSLGAAVTTYDDNIADSSLGANAPTSATWNNYQHLIEVGDLLPSYTVERSMPYINDAAQYIVALGAKCDTGKVQFKSTGYYDLQTNWLSQSVVTSGTSVETGTAVDWRFGEKIHHAMIGSGLVKVGPALGGSGGWTVFGKFLDVTIDHNNNLDKTDYPVGYAGDRGSLTPLQAITTVTGTLKVTEPDVLNLLQSAPALQTISIEHDLATTGHKVIHTFYGCQFDPMDPVVSGQGILTASFTAHAVQDPTSNYQVLITIINGESAASYDPVA